MEFIQFNSQNSSLYTQSVALRNHALYGDIGMPPLSEDDKQIEKENLFFGAVTSDRLVGTVSFYSAAQTYFGYKTDALANAALTDAQKTLPENTAESVLDKGEFEGTASAVIDGFTLLLQDKVIIKTFVQAENATGLKLEVVKYVEDGEYTEDGYVDLSGWKVVATDELVACDGGDGYKAFYAVEDVYDYNTELQFRIVNAEGEVVSATVTYSVASYAARMKDSAAADLLKALMAQAA